MIKPEEIIDSKLIEALGNAGYVIVSKADAAALYALYEANRLAGNMTGRAYDAGKQHMLEAAE